MTGERTRRSRLFEEKSKSEGRDGIFSHPMTCLKSYSRQPGDYSEKLRQDGFGVFYFVYITCRPVLTHLSRETSFLERIQLFFCQQKQSQQAVFGLPDPRGTEWYYKTAAFGTSWLKCLNL